MKKMKKHGYAAASVLVLCMILLSAGCSKRAGVQAGSDYIYCLNGERTGLERVGYEIEPDETQNMVDAVLEELAKPPKDIYYSPAIPKNVTVQETTIKYAVVTVDFDKAYKEISPLEEKLVRAAVVQSLLQIPEINGVMFTVDGESLRDAEGYKIGIMNENDFVQNEGGALSSYEETTLTLYFTDETGETLVEQNVKVKYNSNISREKIIVEKLMNGPKKGSAYPTINSEATLLSVTVKDDICYVNFDGEFLNGANEAKPEITIYSIVNSLTAGTSAEKVQITVNGEKNVKYKETVDLSQPLSWDASWIANEE